MEAVSSGGQYDIALMLLKAGADCKIYMPRSNTQLIHIVAMEEDRRQLWTSQQAADYEKLVKWLEDHGESITKANEDIKRWQSYNNTTPEEYRKKWTPKSPNAKRARLRKTGPTKSPIRSSTYGSGGENNCDQADNATRVAALRSGAFLLVGGNRHGGCR